MPSSVFAHTIARSAIEPLVIHIFAPFSTQSLPCRRATRLHVRGIGAAVRLGEAEAADDFAFRHARQPASVSALRCRMRRSDTCTGSTAPRRSCAGPSRRAPAPGRSARTTPRSGRRSRSPESSCRAAQALRAAGTSSRGKRSSSKHSPMIGITCSSTNLRDRILHQPLFVAEHAANVVQIERIELGGGSGLGGVRRWRTWRFSSNGRVISHDALSESPRAARRSVRGHENRGSMARRVRREPSQPREQGAALDLRAGHRRQSRRPAVVAAGAAAVARDFAAA